MSIVIVNPVTTLFDVNYYHCLTGHLFENPTDTDSDVPIRRRLQQNEEYW